MAEVNVTYQVYTNGKWLPNVTNLSDYAGSFGSPIQAVYANLNKGSIQYRVHTQNGDWLPWVSDRSDYAGSLGKNIDGLQMKVSGLSGYTVKYRAYVGGRWLPWVIGESDYAGIYGQPIEGIQVEIISINSIDSSYAPSARNVTVTYQVYTNGKWLPNVTNLSDYAGSFGSPIQGVYANLDNGSIQYRVHTQNGDWLPWVIDRQDYAGILGQSIDGIQMQISGLSGCNVRYRAYVGGRWLPWVAGLSDYAGLFGQPIEGIQVEITSGNSTGSNYTPSASNGDVNVTYQTCTNGKWLPNVTNLSDYAGSFGSPIQAVYANLDKGSIQYRVHTQNGDWLPWVSDRSDYAGIIGKNVDGLQMKVSGLNGYNVSYRAYVGGRWLPWVVGLSDYAGLFGQPIEGIQVEIIPGNSTGYSDSTDFIYTPVSGARKVFIDAGHGGSDPGAIGNGLNEKDVVLSIAKKLGNILTLKGISVAYSRTSDTFVGLSTRAQLANNLGSTLFVSIHANSSADSSAHGTECYTYPSADNNNKQLSKNIASAISNKLGITNRGHKEADFAVLRETSMPAILVETSFINNPSEANLLRNRKDDFANVIANEILNYFGNPGDKDMSKSKILKYDSSLSPEEQKWGWWCGPASALNAIDCFHYHNTGKNTNHTQGEMAAWLCTIKQTSFDAVWEITLNKFIPGHIYSLQKAENYTHNAWIEKVRELIIRNIDKGFPVIADTTQSKERGFLTSNYKDRNQDKIDHYITVIGYMIKSDGSCYFRYMDSCSYNHGVYTVPLYTLASITHGEARGLVCY